MIEIQIVWFLFPLEIMPKLLNILAEPDPFLRQVALPVQELKAPKIKELIKDMIHTMRKSNGIGLAAIQVKVNQRIIVIDTKDGAIGIINPEITKRSNELVIAEEGCLSVPGTYGFVKRHLSVTARGYDENGEKVEYDAEGLFARVIQHEIDHLNGILFIDSLEDFTQDQKEEVAIIA